MIMVVVKNYIENNYLKSGDVKSRHSLTDIGVDQKIEMFQYLKEEKMLCRSNIRYFTAKL